MIKITLGSVLLASAALLPAAAAAGTPDGWAWPVESHRISREFAPGPHEWSPGHRGVDLSGRPGQTVHAVAAGTVTFVGSIDGVAMVTVTHGGERSTYQPVEASVTVGDAVGAGQPVGRLLAGHHGCTAAACLHLGRLAGETYLDPAELLAVSSRFRLIDPDGPVPAPPGRLGSGELSLPVDGPVSSAFGTRTHPITGVVKLHDGIDLAAPCGTDVRAALTGTVRAVGTAGAYGLRVEVQHADGTATSYSHLSATTTAPGDTVAAGEPIGRVGSTGSSTGCHLHFSVHTPNGPVDPAPLL